MAIADCIMQAKNEGLKLAFPCIGMGNDRIKWQGTRQYISKLANSLQVPVRIIYNDKRFFEQIKSQEWFDKRYPIDQELNTNLTNKTEKMQRVRNNTKNHFRENFKNIEKELQNYNQENLLKEFENLNSENFIDDLHVNSANFTVPRDYEKIIKKSAVIKEKILAKKHKELYQNAMEELDIENTENILGTIHAIQAQIEEQVNDIELTEELILEEQKK